MLDYLKEMVVLLVGILAFLAVMYVIGLVVGWGEPKKEAPPKGVPLQVEAE